MGVQTLRPSATIQTGAYMTLVGGGTAHGNLADGTEAGSADGTAIDLTANAYDANRGTILDLPNPSIPANSRITGVRVRFRARDNSSWPYDSMMRARPLVLDLGGSYYHQGAGVASNWGSTTLTTYNGAYETRTPDGREWTVSDLNNLRVLLTGQTQFFGSGGRISEVWVDVQYDEQPQVTVTGPAESASLGTMYPTVNYTYYDPDGTPLNAVWVRIFSAAQYNAGGFNPDTSAAVADSGWIGSANPGAWTSSVPLPNDTYRAYVKARHAFGAGYYESFWDYNTFSINVTPPPVPFLNVSADSVNSRVYVEAVRGGVAPATEGYDFEYSDNQVNWYALRTPTVAGVTSAGNWDPEAPPNKVRYYRARAYRMASGFRINSAWSAVGSTTLTVTQTVLMDPYTGTFTRLRLEGDALGHDSEEQSQVLYPLGRRNPVVISGAIQGEVYSLALAFPDQASFDAFEALRNTQKVLLLKSARTWQKYIKLVGSRSVTEDRTTADIAPYWYTVNVQAVEQDRP